MVRNSSGSMRCSLRSTKAQRYLPASFRATSRSSTTSAPSPGVQLCSCVATVSFCLLRRRVRQRERKDRQIERNQYKCYQQAHEYKNNGFDDSHKGGKPYAHFFLVEFSDAGEHGSQGAAGFA